MGTRQTNDIGTLCRGIIYSCLHFSSQFWEHKRDSSEAKQILLRYQPQCSAILTYLYDEAFWAPSVIHCHVPLRMGSVCPWSKPKHLRWQVNMGINLHMCTNHHCYSDSCYLDLKKTMGVESGGTPSTTLHFPCCSLFSFQNLESGRRKDGRSGVWVITKQGRVAFWVPLQALRISTYSGTSGLE